MKCPYNGFKECIVEQCPSCVYESITTACIKGMTPSNYSLQWALDAGLAWESTRTEHKFTSCKLIDNNVQPVPPKEEIISTITNTKVNVRHSIF